MATRRENIVARFITRGAQRFKEEVKGAAGSVEQVGQEAKQTSAELEVLKLISSRLEHQHETLILIESRLAHEINDVGDEADKTSAKLTGLGLAARGARGSYRASGLLGLLGVSGRFKDVLSLTGSELRATALTMALYLSPAIVELGTSLASAVTGAGLVGGAGLTSMVVGLSGLVLISKTATGQIQKVTKAQNAYNLAVAQFGRGSAEAARANARLLAAIQTNGGVQVWDAVRAITALKKAWKEQTAPGRGSFFQIISGAVGVGQRLLPTFAKETNKNLAAIRHSAVEAFSQLGGHEVQNNLKVFSRTFRAMFGPLTKGVVNLLFSFFRLMKAAAPYAVLFANAFLRWTEGVRKSSRDQSKLSGFVGRMVDQFKAWWGLLRAVGSLARTIFKGSNEQGKNLVGTLTDLTNRFNDWLGAIVGPNGQTRVSKFFTSFNDNLSLLFTDPGKFITNRVVPFFFNVGAAAAAAIIVGWFHADWRTKLLTAAWLALQVGRSFATGIITGKAFASGFTRAAATGAVPGMAASAAEGGAAATFFTKWGSRLGRLAGAAAIGVMGYMILHDLAMKSSALSQYSGKKGWGELWRDIKHRFSRSPGPAQRQQRRTRPGAAGPTGHGPVIHGKGYQAGGTIPWGVSGLVGETGPELMRASHSGLQITPPGRSPSQAGGLRSMESMMSVSDMLPPVHVHVQVSKREIGRAVVDWQNDTASRRGGRKLQETG